MRKLAVMTVTLLLFVFTFAAAAQAQEISISVDGKQVQTDVPPYITHGRTMVPLRFIAEAFDFKVNWAGEDANDPIQVYPVLPGINEKIKGATDDFGYFSLRPGDPTIMWRSRRFTKDLSAVTEGTIMDDALVAYVDVPPEIRDGRTFVPLRALAEAFGGKVEWDPETRTVKVGAYDPAKILSRHPLLGGYYRADLYPVGLWAKRDGDRVRVGVRVDARNLRGMHLVHIPVVLRFSGQEAETYQDLLWPDSWVGPVGIDPVTFPYPGPGHYTVEAQVDPHGECWDVNRSNNTLRQSVTLD